jgi:hypothetical protein
MAVAEQIRLLTVSTQNFVGLSGITHLIYSLLFGDSIVTLKAESRAGML